jgi:hypothetical protein
MTDDDLIAAARLAWGEGVILPLRSDGFEGVSHLAATGEWRRHGWEARLYKPRRVEGLARHLARVCPEGLRVV